MSRLILQNRPQIESPQLLQSLTEEFRRYDEPDQQYHQPLISVDQPGNRTHLLVIWDVWSSISQLERSALIMDAYKAAYGETAALNVSVAMGLTQDEAAQLGIGFVPAEA